MAAPRGPTRAAAWRRRRHVARTSGGATRVHTDAWVATRGMSSDRLAIDGPMGIVGSGESIGAVTQRVRGALPFIPDSVPL